jgi:hypothetical protein
MGSPDARAYSRNKRGIAGSLIWINFDRHSLLGLIQKCAGTFVADIDEIRPQYTDVTNGGAVFSSSVVRSSGLSAGATINQFDTALTSAGQNSQLATPWYSDQVLPFDVTLSGANEYGAMCAAKIFGLEILNEGFGISIDDAVSEMQATFVARVVEPMAAVASPFQTRYFRPVPCFGTIEKNYRQRGAYSDISIYMNRLWCIFCDLIDRLYRLYAPAPARPRLQPPKLRHLTPAYPENRVN